MLSKYIDPLTFMLCVFANNTDRGQPISFLRLRELRDSVTAILKPENVFIEWTRVAVIGTIESFPDVLRVVDTDVYWVGSMNPDTLLSSDSVGVQLMSAVRSALNTSTGV